MGKHSIVHSGAMWISLGTGPHGNPIWPIDEYLVRTKHTLSVAERIRRLNPNGKEEGYMPRGWHPKGPSKRRLKVRMREPLTIIGYDPAGGDDASAVAVFSRAPDGLAMLEFAATLPSDFLNYSCIMETILKEIADVLRIPWPLLYPKSVKRPRLVVDNTKLGEDPADG